MTRVRPAQRIRAVLAAALALVAGAAALAPRPLVAQRSAARPTPARPPVLARADTARLRRTLDSLVAAYEGAPRGVVGYAVRNLDTGERLDYRADETFPTASLIKVPILVTVFDLVAKGQLSLDDPLTLLPIDKVGGSGQLQFLHPGMSLTVRDAAWLMSTLSDNTATNLLLDRVAIRRVWEKMEALGLPHTKVHSKTFLRLTSVAMDSSVKYGLGVTTPGEMATLFARLAAGTAVTPVADSTMLDILAHNEDLLLLQREVDGVRAPHKTGATDQVRTECTIWELQSRVVTCVMTKENRDQRWIVDSEPQLLMSRLGRSIVAAWPRRPSPPPTSP